MKLRAIILIISCCPFSISSFAQKNEVTFSVGAVATSDQQTNLVGVTCPVNQPACAGPFKTSTDTGVAFEGTFTRRIFNFHVFSIGAEFPIVGVPSRDTTTALTGAIPVGSPGSAPVKSSVSSIFFTPSARIKFLPSSPISPFFSLGGGLAHYEAANAITRGALQYGGGLDFKTPLPHLGLRIEARDFWARGFNESSGITRVSPERLHNVLAGGGVVIRF